MSTSKSDASEHFLLLNEEEVRQVLTMEMALDEVEKGFRKMALDEAVNLPRQRAITDHAMLHVMGASSKNQGAMGAKIYSTSRKGPARFLVNLFDGKTGALLAILQADYLGQMRTGAASGVATKYMARPDAGVVCVLGSGKQAGTQLEAISRVRKIRHAFVHSPNESNRKAFAESWGRRCQIDIQPVADPEKAVRESDIVVTATTSRDPVLKGEWLREGTHINAVGSNFLGKSELDLSVLERCQDVVVDSKEQARMEAGDFSQALEKGVLHWSDVRDLGPVLVGRYSVRNNPGDITLFKSVGLAIEDVVVARRVFQEAVQQGIGRTISW